MMTQKPMQGEQLAIDELLPEAETILHQLIRKALNKQPLYKVKVKLAK